jgi:serine/threonine protein kinase
MLAVALIKQLGPTLANINSKAIHRDVNAHNVLLSDSVEGGPFKCHVEPEEIAARANFWLIDFGLAVDSTTWSTAWREADIGGDCRYWPQSSWFVSFWGANEIAAQKDLCNQYLTRLDVFGLGITALELLCTTALDGSDAAGCKTGSTDGLRGSWRRLLDAWSKYWTDVTRWHTMIYKVFSVGGDVGPLYKELAKEKVVDKILSRMSLIRQCLSSCVRRAEDPRIQSLLKVLADMLDETSNFSLRDAVQALGGECAPELMHHNSSPALASLPIQERPSKNTHPSRMDAHPIPAVPAFASPRPSPAQGMVAAMHAQGAAAQAAAQGMVAQAAASARARAEAANVTARECVQAARAHSFNDEPPIQAFPPIQRAPSLNSRSFVPPLVAGQHAQTTNNSYVPAPLAVNNQPLPSPQVSPTGEAFGPLSKVSQGPKRPQFAGA